MFAWLRRHRPGNPWLGVLYWMLLALAAFAILFVVFWNVDKLLPAMF
jgi:hypothetical protein